ncbi:hypothetical protein [Flexibacterium corallicola]|uniref:hypothetical protein n=1 Tax=Flexibacterium corallicola TaxID=3037259 RepID=UPI00286F7CEB|nr:hypothetical protein [Pseudovibrio sp. M1P-2-3]
MTGVSKYNSAVFSFFLVGVCCGTLPASAQFYSGIWSILDLLSARQCTVVLETELAPGGFGNALSFEGCAGISSSFLQVNAWVWADETGLSMMDSQGKMVMQFDQDELDGLASVHPSRLFLVMEPQREVATAEETPF